MLCSSASLDQKRTTSTAFTTSSWLFMAFKIIFYVYLCFSFGVFKGSIWQLLRYFPWASRLLKKKKKSSNSRIFISVTYEKNIIQKYIKTLYAALASSRINNPLSISHQHYRSDVRFPCCSNVQCSKQAGLFRKGQIEGTRMSQAEYSPKTIWNPWQATVLGDISLWNRPSKWGREGCREAELLVSNSDCRVAFGIELLLSSKGFRVWVRKGLFLTWTAGKF